MELNKDLIKEATHETKTATVAMVALGLRERAHVFTNVSALKAQLIKMGEKVVDKDLMGLFKKLEAAGAGALILGRRGSQTRFEWNYSLRQIAQIALGDKVGEPKKIEAKISEPKAPPLPKVEPPKLPEFYVKAVRLRPDYVAQVFMPTDITSGEIMILAMSILRGKE